MVSDEEEVVLVERVELAVVVVADEAVVLDATVVEAAALADVIVLVSEVTEVAALAADPVVDTSAVEASLVVLDSSSFLFLNSLSSIRSALTSAVGRQLSAHM